MRNWINLCEGLSPDQMHEYDAEGFDVHEILYHGSRFEFTEFDRSQAKTAKHIYTSPDPSTASFYGSVVYECVARQHPQADISGEDADHRLLGRLAEEFADRFHDAVISDEDLQAAKEQVKQRLKSQSDDPDYDDTDADWDAEEDQEYQNKLHEIAKAHAMEFFTSGNVYDYDLKGRFQDEMLDTLFEWGYRSVRMTDYSSQGDPTSVVIDNTDDIRIIGRLK